MRDEVIVKPRPIRGFKKSRILYIPCDSPYGTIRNFTKKEICKEKNLGFGKLFLFKDKTILYQSVGAPAAVLALESLIASGAKEILMLGFCGSINARYKYLNAAVITKAYSEEGTSRHYFPKRRVFTPSPKLSREIESRLTVKKLFFYRGSLVSTDAPYRETTSWLKKNQSRGIDLVDMEASAVFALAENHGVEAAALMIITDEVSSKKWKTGFKYPRLIRCVKDYFFPFLR